MLSDSFLGLSLFLIHIFPIFLRYFSKSFTISQYYTVKYIQVDMTTIAGVYCPTAVSQILIYREKSGIDVMLAIIRWQS